MIENGSQATVLLSVCWFRGVISLVQIECTGILGFFVTLVYTSMVWNTKLVIFLTENKKSKCFSSVLLPLGL